MVLQTLARTFPRTNGARKAFMSSTRTLRTSLSGLVKEAHPFERYPTTMQSQRGDWHSYTTRIARGSSL
jgi:hypothetical protein